MQTLIEMAKILSRVLVSGIPMMMMMMMMMETVMDMMKILRRVETAGNQNSEDDEDGASGHERSKPGEEPGSSDGDQNGDESRFSRKDEGRIPQIRVCFRYSANL